MSGGTGYKCPYCPQRLPTFAQARTHAAKCLTTLLGLDLLLKVQDGELTPDAALAEQAKRPKLKL